ncbi:MAG: competence protein ComEC, partial [Rhizobiales bacterium]|nr:competence protein ComEC [Hyphomicrobiales bacterium]
TVGVACDPAGCVAGLAEGGIAAVGLSAEALGDDCRRAAVVVTRFAAPVWCRGPLAVIDRRALARGGAHALYRLPEAAGDGAPAYRIETAFPAGARRPFMPPGP